MRTETAVKIKRGAAVAIVALLILVGICSALCSSGNEDAFATVFSSDPSVASQTIKVTSDSGTVADEGIYDSKKHSTQTYYTSFTGGHYGTTIKTGQPYIPVGAGYIATSPLTAGDMIVTGCSESDLQLKFSTADDALIISDAPTGSNLYFTFALSDELRKVLKDKMLVVTATPYVVTAGSSLVISQFNGANITDVDSATLSLSMYRGTDAPTSEPDEPSSAILRLSSNDYTQLAVKDEIVVGSSSNLTPVEYASGAFLQVALSNWIKNGDAFTMAIKEVGVRIGVTYNASVAIATNSQNAPSNDPDDIGKMTTCIVQGEDRHIDAPSTYAKKSDKLDINLILRRGSDNMLIDTSAYTDAEPALANCKDGTMFRRLFLDKDDEFLISWLVTDGSIVDGSAIVDETNKSGQAVQFEVDTGGPTTGLLVLEPSISYRNLDTGVLTRITNTNNVSVTIIVDSSAPNAPAVDATGNFYKKYLDEDTGTYFTNVQSSSSSEDLDEAGNYMRLLVTGESNDNRPLLSDASLNLYGGSNEIVYYKTTYVGETVPSTIAEKNSVPFTGPVFAETEENSGVYQAYEGRLTQDMKYYKMVWHKDAVAGDPIRAAYYVRNNHGQYVLTSDKDFVSGTKYYTLEEYNYETRGEFTGIYAKIYPDNECDYGNIYINLVTGTTADGKPLPVKAGVWALEFVTYDLVGKSTMCAAKCFLRVDITDYEFEVQFALGSDFEQTEISRDNVTIKVATLDNDGNDPKDSAYTEAEMDDSGDVQKSIFRLRRANRVSVRVEFKTNAAYNAYVLTRFSVGNIGFSTSNFTYVARRTDLDYAFVNVTANGATKRVYYTFDVDASFCMDESLRRMQFIFKRNADIQVANERQTYDGTSKEVTTSVPALQNIGQTANVVTKYYTAEIFEDEYLVKAGDNDSNIPVEAGTYYYMSEILNHNTYYGKKTGTLTIEKRQPSLTTVAVSGINYGDGLGKIDFNADNRNTAGQQQPSNGIYAIVTEGGREYFLSTMSSDKIPGYYEIGLMNKESPEYLNPKAGDITLTIRFTAVKGTVAGQETTYLYDENGNFIPDANYEIVTCQRTITVVHDDKVTFALNDVQENGNGVVKETTMASTADTTTVYYVEYTYTGARRTVEYTIVSSYEKEEDGSAALDLKPYASIAYAPADSITLTQRQIAALRYADVAPSDAGIYAVRIRLDESRCNYSKDIYTYIVINKIALSVSIEASDAIFDYQYESVPTVNVRYGITDYNNVVEGFIYDYFYYESGKTLDELTDENNRVRAEDLRTETGNPVTAGYYYLKVTIDDPNYEGTGYVRYGVKPVDNGNARFRASWPNVNGSQMNPQYNISYGQPLREIGLGTSMTFSYPYRTFASTGTTTTTTRNVAGKVYVVTVKYAEWLETNELTDSEENRNAYLDEMLNATPAYSVNAYEWFLCFSAETAGENGERIFDKNYDFIYEDTDIYVGKAEIDWTNVTVSPITYGDTVTEDDDLTVSYDLGILYSVAGRTPDDGAYYIRNTRYVYKYVETEYTYGLTNNKPNVSAAGTVNIEIKATFVNNANFAAEYIGSKELVVNKKELTVTYKGNEGATAKKTYRAFEETEFYDGLEFKGYIGENLPAGLRNGTFEYIKDGETVSFGNLTAGEYTVKFTLEHANYSGNAEFTLKISKSKLDVTTKPELRSADINVVYNANVLSSVGFTGGGFRAQGGESVSFTAGAFAVAGRMGVFSSSGSMTMTEITENTAFGTAGTIVRIYFDFFPTDETNYATFEGTDDNGGYIDVTVGKADVSGSMRVSLKQNKFVYKDIICTENDVIDKAINYETTNGLDLNWHIEITNARGETPALGTYLNAGEYTVKAVIDDDNYRGEASCALAVEKKDAFIMLKETNGSKIVTKNGITGVKKPYRGNALNIDFDVYELDGNGQYAIVREAASVAFYSDGVRLSSAPSKIGHYTAEISMATSVNYSLCDVETGERINNLASFLTISVDLSAMELFNLEQVYTVQKTVTVFMGGNEATCTLSYEKDGVSYKELPIDAGTYDIYLNFAAYENNGYEDKINALEITDEKGVSRGYKLIIDRYYTEITAPETVTTTYIGEEIERFTPYTSPYGLALEYYYKGENDVDYTLSTLAGLGALDAGEYEIRILISDKNYRGEKRIIYTVNKARLTERNTPSFGEYEYNTEISPEYTGGGSFVFGATEATGEFVVPVDGIRTLAVGEHTVTYRFIPDSENFMIATGSVRLTVVKQTLGQDFISLGTNGNLLEESDYAVEYKNERYSLKVNYDQSKIYGYPQENGDFTVNLRYTANGTQQSPVAIGTYTVTAEVSSKNYACVKTWEYKLVITTGTPKIVNLPQATRVFAIGETVTGADFTGGKAIIDSDAGTEIFGTFTLNGTAVLTSANTNRFSMTFTPTDTDNFKSVNLQVTALVVGRDPMKTNGVLPVDGKTVNGEEWTEKTFFPTFLPTGESDLIEGTHEGYCGAKIAIRPKSGETSAEYGAAIGAFEVVFVCAHDGCEHCKNAVDRLNDFGTLAFEKNVEYVPSVGEKIAVTYKIRVEDVENAAIYNNMYGYVSTDDIIVRKRLNEANSDFEIIKLAGERGYVVTVYDKAGTRTAFIASVDGKITAGGAFRTNDVSDITVNVTFTGNTAYAQAETANYIISEISTEATEYAFIEEEDFDVEVNSKTYDGKPVTAEDMVISVSNSHLPISADAFTMEIYDGNGNVSDGAAKGAYTVVIYVKDDRNRYYGFLETQFYVAERDVSEEIYLVKGSETVSGETVYYDSYGSGSHTIILAGLDGAELPVSAYRTEIKFEAENDDRYSSVGLLGAGLYTVKVTVATADYRGEKVFLYRVDPQRITMVLAETTYAVEYGSSEHNSFAIAPAFRTETGENFTFEGRGGYTVSYYSAGYPKQTTAPLNAGEYTIIVEAVGANYRIVNGTAQYTIRPRTTRIATPPTPLAVDERGNNLVYGQKLSLLGLRTDSAEVTDSSGNVISGTFAVKDTEREIIPNAGSYTVTLVFTPSNRNYAISETTITVGVARKTVRIEFDNLSSFYTGATRRNELSYKDITDPITVVFEFLNATGQVVEPVAAGVYSIRASVNNANYVVEMSATTDGTGSGTPVFTVRRAEANVNLAVNPVASSVGVGESLNKSSLSGGRIYYRGFSDPIKGSFAYVEGGRAYTSAGTYDVEYIFNPDDSANFASYRGTVQIEVGRGVATVTPGENAVEYGTPADFTSLDFTTAPAGMNGDIKFEFVCDGKTYKQGDIIPAGTYWFTCWIDGVNYRSERTSFSYVVNKKEIDIDFVDGNGNVVTSYSTGYGENANVDVRLYDANTSDKRTYLLKDADTIRRNIEYRYVSRGETASYDGYNAPTAIGSYDLTVTLRHDDYVATKTVIYRVTTGRVTDITFDVDTLINQTYGAVVPPIVTTTPANVSYYIIYQGYYTTLPTSVGSYNVTVYIDDDNYASTQMSAVFRINPKPLEVTGLTVKDKAYDGVATLEINGSLTGVLYSDEVKLELTARTYNGATNKGEHFVEITGCKLSGLHASNYTLTDYPVYENKIKIYENIVKDNGSGSYIMSDSGFADGTSVTFRDLGTKRNATSIWTKMLGVEATVKAYTVTVNNAEVVNGNQYKVCVEIPEQYRNSNFTVEFDGALKGQPISYTREGNFISFYASTSSGEIVFQNAEFKYEYVVTAAILLIILIAVVVLLILNPLQHRRSVTDPRATRDAVRRIKEEKRKR